jgi:hypothetical protein
LAFLFLLLKKFGNIILTKIKKKVLICCNDSGGANLIYHWYLKKKNIYNFFFYNSGPAKKIFGKKNILYKTLKKKKFDFVVTGTSVKSNIEKKVRSIFKNKDIRSIVYIDHYTNYNQRFFYKNKYLFPDEIWCHDIYSYKKCKKIIKKKSLIKLKKNYYLEYAKKKIKKFSLQKTRPKTKTCLFLSEPIQKKINITIDQICNRINFFLKKKKIKILYIKLHPSENITNMRYVMNKIQSKQTKVTIIKYNLFKWIGYSNYIVGLRSYAMVVSLYSGKLTYSLLLKKHKKFFLPFKKFLKF